MTDPTEPTPFELEADEGSAIQAAVPPPSGALLIAEDIVAGYVPEVNILNGVPVTVAPGELIGIIGPNGAGKSTFLKDLFGPLPIRSGSVTLLGEDLTVAKAHQLVAQGVGYVPQNNNVCPRLRAEARRVGQESVSKRS